MHVKLRKVMPQGILHTLGAGQECKSTPKRVEPESELIDRY